MTINIGSSQDTLYWDNGGGDYLWTNPLNWDTDALPTVTSYVHVGIPTLGIIIPTGSNITIQRLRTVWPSLTIEAGATLTINGSVSHGFDPDASVFNYGVINIKNTVLNGLNLSLYNGGSTEQIFHNYGELYIDEGIGKHGIEQFDTSKLINHSSGYIEINDYTENGIECGDLYNSGRIKILGENGNPGIHLNLAACNIVNEDCGKVVLQSQIELVTGTITNNGFFRQEYDGINIMPIHYLINNGFLEDVLNSYQSTDVNNLSFSTKPIAAQVYQGSLQSIFKIGNDSTSHTMSSVYKEHNLTTLAGPYNNTSHNWQPNSAAVGESVFYVAVTDVSNACIDTIKFILDLPVEAMNYWVGNSGLWNVATNWSTGQVPQTGESAAIFKKNITVTNPIGNTANVGSLISHSNILNKPGASMIFRNGLLNDGLFMNLCTLTNNGTLDVLNYNTGLRFNDANVINNNLMTIKSCDYGLYFFEYDPYVFNNHGDIDINDCIRGMYVKNIINEAGGEINILCQSNNIYGVNSSGMENYGDINIVGSGVGDGFQGEADNFASGIITADNFIDAIDYEGNNYGQLIAKNSTYGIHLMVYPFINKASGSMTIDDCFTGILVNDPGLINEAGGEIAINHCDYGFTVNNSFGFGTPSNKFYNYGNVDITNSTVAGLKLYDEFNNYNTGHLTINASLDYGVHLQSGKLLNDGGDIIVKNTTGIGIYAEGSTFDNKTGGTLLLDNIGGDGISLKDFMDPPYTYYSTFDNDGEVNITENVTGNSFTATINTNIYNASCRGVLNVSGAIDHPGLFNNYGLLHQKKTATHSLSSSFNNYGILIDTFNTFASEPITDLGYTFKNIAGQYKEGDTVLDPLNDNSATYFVTINTTWFKDPALTIPTGDYDDINKTFVPNSSAIGDSIFYFVADWSCLTDTLSIEFDNPISEPCGTNIWIGGTSIWNNINNWSLARLPTSCDVVQMVNLTDSILINSSFNADIKQLSVTGSLLINPNANLTINGSPSYGVLNNGKVQNKGTLTILNSNNSGVRNLASSVFINDGTLSIQNSGSNGIRQEAATFTNFGIIELLNNTFNGLLLENGAVFIDKGSTTVE
jgi:hypothetical protein